MSGAGQLEAMDGAELRAKLDEMLADHRPRHDDVQMDSFITVQAGYGNLFGMYRQALRELHGRFGSLRSLAFQARELEIDVDELWWQVGEEEKRLTHAHSVGDKFKLRRLRLDLDRKVAARKSLELAVSEARREFQRFFEQALHFKEQLGTLTPAKRKELELGFWHERMRCRLAIEVMRDGAPSVDLLHTIGHMRPELRASLMTDVQDPRSAIQWFKTREPVEIPELPSSHEFVEQLDATRVEALLE